MKLLEQKLSGKISALLALSSALLLSCGWIEISGLPLLIAFIPLLILSEQYSSTIKDTLKMAGWAALVFIIWNLSTIWWVWNAAAIGTIAATIVSSWWSLLPFMLFHIVSKRMPKVVAYILLIAGWIGCEYIYLEAPAMSFPWLVIGNGFALDTWAVQWYEYTGVLGGSLWVLLANILIFEALKSKRIAKISAAAIVVIIPIILSVVLYAKNAPEKQSSERVTISAIQPNIDCYIKFNNSRELQHKNIISLLRETPKQSTFILMPETSLAETVNERFISATRIVQGISSLVDKNTMVIAGTESIVPYGNRRKSDTNRRTRDGVYYDIFNSAIGITTDPLNIPVHHKGKLVIGVETLPAWFRAGGLFGVDLGGVAGQLGIGESQKPFTHNNIKIAPAICYEALYGDYMGEFVRNGAQILSVVSNDGWWGDTPGYRYLFAFCRLRAIEHRRDIARSANTGISGFINSRGDVLQSMDWDTKGVITQELSLYDEQTVYTRYGDFIGRIALYIALLCILYTIAIESKRRFYLD